MCSLMCIICLVCWAVAAFTHNANVNIYLLVSALFGIGSSIEILANKLTKK